MVADIDPHVIGITESSANKDIADAELALTGYVRIDEKEGEVESFYILKNLSKYMK